MCCLYRPQIQLQLVNTRPHRFAVLTWVLLSLQQVPSSLPGTGDLALPKATARWLPKLGVCAACSNCQIWPQLLDTVQDQEASAFILRCLGPANSRPTAAELLEDLFLQK